jgi:hypothetical protein
MFGLQWYHMTLITLAALAAWSAWNVPRAVLWIGLGAFFYIVSAWWHNAGWPYATVFGAATNLVMCYLFWIWAEQRFEERLWNAYHLMLVIDVLFIFGYIRSQYDFAVSLEIVNAIALLFVIGVGIAERADGIRARSPHPGRPGFVHRSLFAERSAAYRPPWQK